MALFDDLRSAWGARPPKDKSDLVYVAPSRRTEFMSHWNGPATGLTASSSHSRCLAVVKADQDFHMDGRGWNDIGYNGLICPHGRAIECRGIDYAGAHCPNHNTSAYGWQFAIGKGETATPAMFTRMAKALADCEARSGHDLRLLGHRDGFSTECPGDQIELWVKAGMPTNQSQEDDMPDPKDLWNYPIPAPDGSRSYTAADWLRYANLKAENANATAGAALAVVKALAAKPGGLTAAEITEAAKVGAKAALDEEIDSATVTLNTKES